MRNTISKWFFILGEVKENQAEAIVKRSYSVNEKCRASSNSPAMENISVDDNAKKKQTIGEESIHHGKVHVYRNCEITSKFSVFKVD